MRESNFRKQKNITVVLAGLLGLAIIFGLCALYWIFKLTVTLDETRARLRESERTARLYDFTEDFSDGMKLPRMVDFNDPGGASSIERNGDHKGSPYFYHADFYNPDAKPTKTLDLLPRFQTLQQTSSWSCGPSCAEMVLHYWKLDDNGNWNEKTLAGLRSDHSDIHPGTCLEQMIEIFNRVGGFELETTFDYEDRLDEINFAFLKRHIEGGVPIIIGWNDWGGHWQVIIGYDDMGTEYEGDDVIIVADPFDSTDHNQDGYGVYGAERFLENFTFYDVIGDEAHLRDKCFIAAWPAELAQHN